MSLLSECPITSALNANLFLSCPAKPLGSAWPTSLHRGLDAQRENGALMQSHPVPVSLLYPAFQHEEESCVVLLFRCSASERTSLQKVCILLCSLYTSLKAIMSLESPCTSFTRLFLCSEVVRWESKNTERPSRRA